MSFEPGTFGVRDPGTSLYACRTNSVVELKALEGDYAYAVQDWYQLPKELRHAVWTEPYFDEGGGGILMSTFAVPIFLGPAYDRFAGVATCDVSLG